MIPDDSTIIDGRDIGVGDYIEQRDGVFEVVDVENGPAPGHRWLSVVAPDGSRERVIVRDFQRFRAWQ